MRELAKLGIYASALPMPTPEKPVCSEWLEMMNYCIGKSNKDVYLVGHSLGVPAILRYLENTKAKVGGVVLVSGPIRRKKGYKKGKLDTFFETPFDFNLIKKRAGKFTVIHGDDDRFVPVEQAKELADKLSCELNLIKNGGHLNGGSGVYELPESLTALQNIAGLK